jgi:N-methylhydantoinase B/oxoprolinase/acetone carboxylase alpha subunit
MTSNATTVDPVTTEVVASRLRETAATMEYALYHSGYSPILRESKDGTAGLTDPEGRVVIISGAGGARALSGSRPEAGRELHQQ